MAEMALTLEKLEMLVYFMDAVSMSRMQRDTATRVIMESILRGSVDPDSIFATLPVLPDSNVSSFLQSVAEKGGGEYQASDLYCRYIEWCSACKVRSVSLNRFGSVLQELGTKKIKKADANYYLIESKGAS